MERSQLLVRVAAGLSLVAAAIHAWVVPKHFREWWGYGTFFLVVAVAQALFAVAVVRAPRPWLLRLGIAGNLAVIALWAVTRTVGIPVFGPHAGEVEAVGSVDVITKAAEVALVAMLVALCRSAGLERRAPAAGSRGRQPA